MLYAVRVCFCQATYSNILEGFIGGAFHSCVFFKRSNRLRRFAQQSISKKEKRELEEAQATGFPFGVGGYYFYGPCP